MPAERLYLADAHLLCFQARVTDIREYARRDGKQVWQLALDRSAFYPTGGGQPHDMGTVTARARSGASLCVAVEDVNEDESGEVWHTTGKPLPVGTEVEARLDAGRRRDHTQQHSGQHLLSALLANEFGAQTVSFHLGERDTTIDLAVTSAEAQAALLARLAEVERRVNEEIAANLTVHVRSVARAEADALLAQGRLRKLPPVQGSVRLVEIAGLDLNACGGTHVAALGELGAVLLRETERVKQGLRLHFVCGLRAVRASRSDWDQLCAAAAPLSVSRDSVAGAVERQVAQLRAFAKENQRLREELAAAHAAELSRSERPSGLIERQFSGRDAESLRLLARALLAHAPNTTAILSTATGDAASVVLASNAALPGGCGGTMKQVLAQHGLRGGGAPELAQAQLAAALLAPVLDSLRDELRRRGADKPGAQLQ